MTTRNPLATYFTKAQFRSATKAFPRDKDAASTMDWAINLAFATAQFKSIAFMRIYDVLRNAGEHQIARQLQEYLQS